MVIFNSNLLNYHRVCDKIMTWIQAHLKMGSEVAWIEKKTGWQSISRANHWSLHSKILHVYQGYLSVFLIECNWIANHLYYIYWLQFSKTLQYLYTEVHAAYDSKNIGNGNLFRPTKTSIWDISPSILNGFQNIFKPYYPCPRHLLFHANCCT